jgi:hypothetical protein
MVEPLSAASTAVPSANVAVVDYGEVGRSAMYNSRYNNGPRTLPRGTLSWTGETSVYSASTFTRKYQLCK